jgi:ABC-type phosphate/phosphonate transport system substrate-binding protein
MKPITFLVPASLDVSDEALHALCDQVGRASGVRLDRVRLPSRGLLPQALASAPDALAWAPSGFASPLGRLDLASPLVRVRRRDRRTRSAVLVARGNIAGVADLRGQRVGWVSRLSVTGYEVPRQYLESTGLDVAELFASERFFGTHDAAIAGLAHGTVDVIATHTGKLRTFSAPTPMRVLATIGPIEADLIVGGSAMGAGVRAGLAQALRSASIGPYAFDMMEGRRGATPVSVSYCPAASLGRTGGLTLSEGTHVSMRAVLAELSPLPG